MKDEKSNPYSYAIAFHLVLGVIGQNVEVFAVFCVEVFMVKLGLRQQPQFDCTSIVPRASFGVRRTCLGGA